MLGCGDEVVVLTIPKFNELSFEVFGGQACGFLFRGGGDNAKDIILEKLAQIKN